MEKIFFIIIIGTLGAVILMISLILMDYIHRKKRDKEIQKEKEIMIELSQLREGSDFFNAGLCSFCETKMEKEK